MGFGAWIEATASFLIVSFASSRIGLFFPKIQMPLLSGYIVTGMISGPDLCHLLSREQLPELFFVTQIALAFIAFSAGSELYLPELREMLKQIAYITAGLVAAMLLIATPVIFGMLQLHVYILFDEERPAAMLFACALLAVSVLISLSPATTIAVVKETRAKGPFTACMLGIIVVCDVVVLVLFALSTGIARAQEGGSFSPITLISLFGEILLSIGLGYLTGKLIVFVLWIPKFPGEMLILPIGYLWFLAEQQFAHLSERLIQHDITLEPLLICIAAGYVATNQSKHRMKFLKMIQITAPYVFIPFFTLSGLNLKLGVMAKGLGFSVAVFALRAVCVFGGGVGGAYMAKAVPEHRKYMWMTFIAQSGVSIGLASKISISFESWGESLSTVLISVILIDVLLGPVLCKLAIKRVGEARTLAEAAADVSGGGEGPQQKIFVLGINASSLGVVRRLLQEGLAIVVADTPREKFGCIDEVERAYEDSLAVKAADHNGHGHEEGRKGVIDRRPLENVDQEGLVEALKEITKDLTHINTVGMLAALDQDADNYTACKYFKHFVGVKRVVAHLTNPLWKKPYVDLDVSPICSTSLEAHIAYKVLRTAPGKALDLLPGKLTSGLLSTFIHGDDSQILMASLTDVERESFQEHHHPPPVEKDISTPRPNMFDNTIEHVPRDKRDEYLAHLGLREEDARDIWAEEQHVHDTLALNATSVGSLLDTSDDEDNVGKPMLGTQIVRSDSAMSTRPPNSSNFV